MYFMDSRIRSIRANMNIPRVNIFQKEKMKLPFIKYVRIEMPTRTQVDRIIRRTILYVSSITDRRMI